MKNTALALSLVLIGLLASVLVLISTVKAQDPLNLTIKPDGSVEPDTDIVWLQRNETTYTFIVDFFGTITVQKAGITIDGAGHTLQGGINLVGHDETYNAYSNVLVKNLRIYNFSEGIITPSNNNSFIGNRFDNARIHILGGPLGNVIKHNVFNSTEIFVDYNMGGNDVITENNFIDSSILVDIAKPPIVDKNYWSNYTTKYPNATEIEGLGIWDTPYVDDRYAWATNTSIDYHPLVNPITDFEIPNFGIPTMPTLTPYPTINTGPEPPQTEPFLTTLAVVIVVSVAVAGVGLLVYFKKRKRKVG